METNVRYYVNWEGRRPVVLLFDEDGLIPRGATIRAAVMEVDETVLSSMIMPKLVKMIDKMGNFPSIWRLFEKRKLSYFRRHGVSPMYAREVEVITVPGDGSFETAVARGHGGEINENKIKLEA